MTFLAHLNNLLTYIILDTALVIRLHAQMIMFYDSP